MPLPRQGAWPAHPGMGKGKMRGRCSDGACSCPDCPSRARKPMARGLGLPGDMPEAARQALILALGGEIAEDVDEDEGDEASALMARLLPSILLEESVTRSKCDDCPNKGSCGGCADKADCGSDCKGEGEKKANPECDCPCNGACGGDCENCPMKKKADAEKAAKKDCCGSCGGAETPAK